MHHADRGFVDLDEDTAPEAAKAMLAATRERFGFLPSALARMVAAPALARAFQQAHQTFERTSFSALEREIAVVVLAHCIDCEVCVAIHAGMLVRLGRPEIAEQLARGVPLATPRLAALVAMTEAIWRERGDVDPAVFDAFLAAGFSRTQALELVIGVGAYVMSMFANRLTGAPVDPQLRG